MSHLSLVPVGPGAQAESGRYEISGDLALVVGRDASCDIRVDESQDVVSRRHVTIRWDGSSLVAHDSSSNGLFVNGQRVVKLQPIHDEDVMQLGHNGPVFTVALDPKPVKAPPPARETRTLAPTRPPQPVIHIEADVPPAPAPSPSVSPSAQEALKDMAQSGKQLLTGAAASIKRSIEERIPPKDSPTGEALQDMARGGKKLLASATASIKQTMEEQGGTTPLQPLPSISKTSSSGGFFMLSRIIVQLYTIIIEVALWLLLLIAIGTGWKFYGMLGALVGIVLAALFGAVFFGAFLVLGDLRLSVRRIEDKIVAKE